MPKRKGAGDAFRVLLDELFGGVFDVAESAVGDPIEGLVEHLTLSGIGDVDTFQKWQNKDLKHIAGLVAEYESQYKSAPKAFVKENAAVAAIESIAHTVKRLKTEPDPTLLKADSLTENSPISEAVPDVEAALESDRDISTDKLERDLAEPDHGGFHLPSDRYLGPGNPLENGPPVDAVDAAARIHDYRYDQIHNLGINPYTHYTIADDELLKNLEHKTGARASLARAFFKFKKFTFPHAHFQDTLPAVPSWTAAHLGAEAMQEDSAVSGAGGDGIGPALWAQGASFTGDAVTCFMTRRCYLPFDEDPSYRVISHNGLDFASLSERFTVQGTHAILGYVTPWHYVDYNNISLFFSPAEFQYLLENYEQICPKGMTSVISDLVIKDVTIQDGKTQVTDSGTGGVAIFADTTYEYPYVIGNGQKTLPSDIPMQVYELPKYAYLTCGKKTSVGHTGGTLPTGDTDFYMLEHSIFKIFKTGDHFVSSYEFPSLRPRSLVGASQHFFMMQNPAYDYALDVLEKVGTTGRWTSLDKDHFNERPQNYFPGPRIPSHRATEGDHGMSAELQRVDTGTSIGDGWYSRYSFRPMPSCQAYSHSDTRDPDSDIPHVSVDAVAHGQQDESPRPANSKQTTHPYKMGRLPNDIEMAKQLQGVEDTVFLAQQLAGKDLKQAQIVPLMPGSVWNERALHYESQIWTKIPNLDKHFMADHPALGGWGVESPPPQIFIKMMPTPAPSAEAGKNGTGTLHQYAIFNLTVKFTFQLKRRSLAGRWNPQPPVYPPSAQGHMPYVLYDNGQLQGVSSETQAKNGYERSAELWTAKARVKHL